MSCPAGWSAGHESLAEITPEQVRAALPEHGSQRNWAEYGLRPTPTWNGRPPEERVADTLSTDAMLPDR